MKKISRRQFLSCSAALLSAALPAYAYWPFNEKTGPQSSLADIRGRVFKNDAPSKLWRWSHEGFLYKKMGSNKVICEICPNRCLLAPGDRSICRSKVNMDGKLFSLVYGNPCAANLDPIEKKPLYHFLPRTKAFSIATAGCNFRCPNCQNWEISQFKPQEVRHFELFPPEAVQAATQSGAASIAYTYSEAITFFEYMIDVARMARLAGLNNLFISNGYINKAPLLELCKVLDAANIDLKSFDDAIYRKLTGGRLKPVLDTLKTLREQRVHTEVAALVVPDFTDDPEIIKQMCRWFLENLGPDTPLHFLRFFPKYKLDRLGPTPISTISRFREMAMAEGIHYVYVGNVPGHEGNHTFCHHCKRLLVERQGYSIPTYNLEGRRCIFCQTVIPGRWHIIPEDRI